MHFNGIIQNTDAPKSKHKHADGPAYNSIKFRYLELNGLTNVYVTTVAIYYFYLLNK